MLSQDEQIALFVDAINKNALKMCREIEKEARKLYTEEAQKLEAEVEAAMKTKLENAESRIMTELNRRAAAEKSSARNEIYKLREKLTDDVFEKAKAILVSFASSDKYHAFLEKSIEKTAAVMKNSFVLYARKTDVEAVREAAGKTGADFTVEETADIEIGGVRVFSPSENIIVDDTLDERLLEQREWFLSHSGKELNII